MQKYYIRELQADDCKAASDVYNSNPGFLRSHLEMDCVDEYFIAEEAANMCKAGFFSCVIAEWESVAVRGVIDYKPGEETYLSLLMLDADAQGKGIGRAVYLDFEDRMRRNGCTSIRIDVVNDYPGNAAPFWKRLGFLEEGEIALSWGNRRSRALVMRKRI